VAVIRHFDLERASLVFRAEVFNAANHTQLAIPVRFAEAPAFGSSFETLVPPRVIQFALKLSF
jgi:hypothetical protein